MAVGNGGAFVAGEAEGSHRLAGGQGVADPLQHAQHESRLLVTGVGDAAIAIHGPLGGGEVREREFELDHLHVVGGRHVPRRRGDVRHVVVGKAAHHVGDGVGLADVGEKLVAEPLALGSPGHQPGDVHELHGARHHAGRLDDGGDAVQARVRHRHHAGVGFDGAERKVLGADGGLGEGVEQRRLADVGQPDDAAVEAHVETVP